MPVIDEIQNFSDDLIKIFQDFHQHPELGMEEVRTSKKVNEFLNDVGIKTYTGIGKMGVVGVLEGNKPGKQLD